MRSGIVAACAVSNNQAAVWHHRNAFEAKELRDRSVAIKKAFYTRTHDCSHEAVFNFSHSAAASIGNINLSIGAQGQSLRSVKRGIGGKAVCAALNTGASKCGYRAIQKHASNSLIVRICH